MAYSNRRPARMLAGDRTPRVGLGAAGAGARRAVGDRETEIHALNNIGTAMSRGDRIEGDGTLLARSLDLALAEDAHEHAARAYTNLVSCAVQTRDFAAAERHARAGIELLRERDLDSWRCTWPPGSAGRYSSRAGSTDARRVARGMLVRPGLSTVTRIPALVVAGDRGGPDAGSPTPAACSTRRPARGSDR